MRVWVGFRQPEIPSFVVRINVACNHLATLPGLQVKPCWFPALINRRNRAKDNTEGKGRDGGRTARPCPGGRRWPWLSWALAKADAAKLSGAGKGEAPGKGLELCWKCPDLRH